MPTLLLVDVPADMVPGSLTVTARREGKAGTETLTVREVSRPEDVAEVLEQAAHYIEGELAGIAGADDDSWPSDLRALAAGYAALTERVAELEDELENAQEREDEIESDCRRTVEQTRHEAHLAHQRHRDQLGRAEDRERSERIRADEAERGETRKGWRGYL